MKKAVLLALISCLFLAVSSSAQVYTYLHNEKPAFSITYPHAWSVVTELDEHIMDRPEGVPPMPPLVSARPPEGLLWFGTWVIHEAKTFDDARDYLLSLTEHIFKDYEPQDRSEGEHNGMKFRYVEGTAVKTGKGRYLEDGDKVDFIVAFFKPGQDLMGIAFCVAIPEDMAKYHTAVTTAIESLRPARD